MNKKFASLGTALSRDEAKKVMGGDEESKLRGDGSCSMSATCPGLGGSSYSISCNGTSSCKWEYITISHSGAAVVCGVNCDGMVVECPYN